ncbi:MAG: 3-hydroxyacyl-ACP dehydratase FabZ [Desulfovibrionales bacterium]
MSTSEELVTNDILEILPHRYPFLLVDKVVEFTPYNSITALKNVTINEPFFQGHFPGYPVMPGVLILESMAQVGGILVKKSIPEEMDDKIFLFTGIEKARFRRPVMPGDQLILKINYVNHKMNIWKMEGKVFVGESLVTQGVLSAAVVARRQAS